MYDRRFGGDPEQTVLEPLRGRLGPGQLMAFPVPGPARVLHDSGSSNAAALASRLAGLAYERLRVVDGLPPDADGLTVLLKALLVHGADWGAAGARLAEVFPDLGPGATDDEDRSIPWQHRDEGLARFLGYGRVDPDVALFCTPHRITAVATGELEDGGAHVYELPLPPSFPTDRIRRKVTATLAWNTPINVRHRYYRRAALMLSWPGPDSLRLGKEDVGATVAQRGTVEHVVRGGDRAVAVAADSVVRLQVNCRSHAGFIDEPVRYGLAVTLDIAPPLHAPMFPVRYYEEMREAIAERIRVQRERPPAAA
jgi:hypothetical protein